MPRHVKISKTKEAIRFDHNNLALVNSEGIEICLANFNDEIAAFANQCPHANGRLNDGYLDAKGNIVCPVHFYKFNIFTGRMQAHDDCRLKIYNTLEKADGFYVEL